MPSPLPPILDACCGGRMMYFDKRDPRVLGQDIRKVPRHKIASNGSYFEVRPDHIGDFRHMDFPDEAFSLVVFDPPHLRCGETSFMFHKYGSLGAKWEDDLRKGFAECFRVLKTNGTLVFKWSDSFKSLDGVLGLTPYKPVLSHRTESRSLQRNTYFVIFIKDDEQMQAEEEEHARNRDALSLIRAHYDGDEARFREVAERLAADFDSAGRGELASFIRAQTGSEPSWVPMDLVPMDQEDKPCAD